ncbi:MAG: polysaccharide biosynthesis protein, partial [Proteobacteria bacterium]|nr:polysaccharide biosynthesis protein [Pseudomonadota bacterium]
IEVLAEALLQLFNADTGVKIIGTRHGEKVHETLASSEELAHSEDMGDFFRIMPDHRDLNYSAYFNEGTTKMDQIDDYTSNNTNRLSVEQTKELLLSLPEVQKELEMVN